MDWSGRTVLVAGLGVSGFAAARALLRAGAVVRAVDSGEGEAVRARVRELASLGADARAGVSFDASGLLGGVDLLVPSPGLAQGSPLVSAALTDDLPVWSEPELAWALSDGQTRLVVVTGTNGKTTTTELLGALLDAPTGGNIGTPLSDLLLLQSPPTAVAELSSFQLRFTETLRPDVAVLLNVAPDHLDWHGGLDAYEAAKARAWRRSGPHDWLVVGDDDGARRAIRNHPTDARIIEVTRGPVGAGQVGFVDGRLTVAVDGERVEVAEAGEMRLRGAHNLDNACAAVAAAVALGADPAALREPLLGYSAGPHRLALIAQRDGIRWIDDSKATNPHAAAAALSSCGGTGASIVWIAGGLGKGLEFSELKDPVRAHVRHAITIGASGPEIGRLARACEIDTTDAGDLERAVAAARRVARPGDTVLLAPACASMDQFTDYAERGRVFAALANEPVEAGS